MGKNWAKLRKDIEEYHTAYAIDFDDADIDTFVALRPDGLAFGMEEKLCVFLEYTRTMDTNEDWAERKEQEKNDRYISLLGFINHLSHQEKSGWKASQPNFTTGERGSLHTEKPRQNSRKMTSFRGTMGRHGQAGSWRGQ